MKTHSNFLRIVSIFVCLVVLAVSGLVGTSGSAYAQSKSHAKRNGLIAGVGAYAIAKHTGKNRLRHGQKRNFAQRHPVLTGIAAYGIAHHYSKKHHKH